MKYIIGRPINDISTNGLEYLLNDEMEEVQFDTMEDAIECLRVLGATQEEIDDYYVFCITGVCPLCNETIIVKTTNTYDCGDGIYDFQCPSCNKWVLYQDGFSKPFCEMTEQEREEVINNGFDWQRYAHDVLVNLGSNVDYSHIESPLDAIYLFVGEHWNNLASNHENINNFKNWIASLPLEPLQ